MKKHLTESGIHELAMLYTRHCFEKGYSTKFSTAKKPRPEDYLEMYNAAYSKILEANQNS